MKILISCYSIVSLLPHISIVRSQVSVRLHSGHQEHTTWLPITCLCTVHSVPFAGVVPIAGVAMV